MLFFLDKNTFDGILAFFYGSFFDVSILDGSIRMNKSRDAKHGLIKWILDVGSTEIILSGWYTRGVFPSGR